MRGALSFKYLRKFVADWMTRKGGEMMGKVALAHSRSDSVLRRHSTSPQDFDAFKLEPWTLTRR